MSLPVGPLIPGEKEVRNANLQYIFCQVDSVLSADGRRPVRPGLEYNRSARGVKIVRNCVTAVSLFEAARATEIDLVSS